MPQQGEPGGGGGGSASTLEDQVAAALNGFRLTLASGDPVPTADQTAKTTVYLTPYAHRSIGLYDGSRWEAVESDEVSIAVPATTATVYDVFAYSNSGVLTLELVAWSTATARATALARQDGVLTKSGDATRRYVGSFRTTGVSGQTEDSESNRFLWNVENQVLRQALISDSTDHAFDGSAAAVRYFNNDTTLKASLLLGLNQVVEVTATVYASQGATGRVAYVYALIDGLPSGSGSIALSVTSQDQDTTVDGGARQRTSRKDLSLLGYHTLDLGEDTDGGSCNFDFGEARLVWLG